MNKSSIIRKLGAILQTKKATKEEVKEAYENSSHLKGAIKMSGKPMPKPPKEE